MITCDKCGKTVKGYNYITTCGCHFCNKCFDKVEQLVKAWVLKDD